MVSGVRRTRPIPGSEKGQGAVSGVDEGHVSS